MLTPRGVECRSPKGRPLRPGSTTCRETTAGASLIGSRRLARRIVRTKGKTRPNIGPDAEKKMPCRQISMQARRIAGPALRSGETAGHVPTGKRTVVGRKSPCGQKVITVSLHVVLLACPWTMVMPAGADQTLVLPCSLSVMTTASKAARRPCALRTGRRARDRKGPGPRRSCRGWRLPGGAGRQNHLRKRSPTPSPRHQRCMRPSLIVDRLKDDLRPIESQCMTK